MNYYTGIGSRDTPANILTIMKHVASEFAAQGWTLRSGGADGADLAFEEGCDLNQGKKEIYLPWSGFNHSKSALSGSVFPFTKEEINFARAMHPAWDKCSPGAQKMHTRNVRQVVGLEALHGPVVQPSKVIICWTKNGQLIGGTSQALRIAHYAEVPVINFGAAKDNKELENMLHSIEKLFK